MRERCSIRGGENAFDSVYCAGRASRDAEVEALRAELEETRTKLQTWEPIIAWLSATLGLVDFYREVNDA